MANYVCMYVFVKPLVKYSCLQSIMCLKIGSRSSRLLLGQRRQPFEWNYFPLLTERIVLSNKNRNLRKYSAVFFKAFSKKKVSWQTLYFNNKLFLLFAAWCLSPWTDIQNKLELKFGDVIWFFFFFLVFLFFLSWYMKLKIYLSFIVLHILLLLLLLFRRMRINY